MGGLSKIKLKLIYYIIRQNSIGFNVHNTIMVDKTIDMTNDKNVFELYHRLSQNEQELNDILTIDDGETKVEDLDLQLVEKLEWKPEQNGEFTFEIEGNTHIVEVKNALIDSDIYLNDDWGDNKLQDRDDSGTTTYNGVTGVYRPEWESLSGGFPEATEGEIVAKQGESTIAEVNINLGETVTWELTDLFFDGASSSDNCGLTLYAAQDNTVGVSSFVPAALYEGYYLRRRKDDPTLSIDKVDGDGNVTQEIAALNSGSGPSTYNSIEIVREPNGDWSIDADGDTANGNDDEFDEANYVTFACRDEDDSNEARLNELKIN